jgi:hypothetical protein
MTRDMAQHMQDYAGWVLNAPLADLNAEQKVLRYFIRYTNIHERHDSYMRDMTHTRET